MRSDRIGGRALTAAGGGVTRERDSAGHVYAQLDGASYLDAAAEDLGDLSDYASGLTAYVVLLEDAASADNAMPLAIWKTPAASAEGTLRVYRSGSSDYWAAGAWSTSGQGNDLGEVTVGTGVKHVVAASWHATNGQFVSVGGRVTASPNATAVDPTSLARLTIGTGPWAGSLSTFYFTGRVYRVVLAAGPYSQSFADTLANYYNPRRLPPSVDTSDVRFVYDARHASLRDTLNGIDLAPASVPAVVAANGDVAMSFDGVDDELSGSLALGLLDGTLSLYVVAAPGATGSLYHLAVEDSGNSAQEHLAVLSNSTNTLGGWAVLRDGGVISQHYGTHGLPVGELGVISAEITPTTLRAWLDGNLGTQSTSDTATPSGIDSVALGSYLDSTLFSNTDVLYALIVEAARDSLVEDYLHREFAESRPWIPWGVSEADALEVYDPNWSTDRFSKPASSEDVASASVGTVTDGTDAAGLGLVRLAASSYTYHVSPSLTKLSDQDQVTCYLVGSVNDSYTFASQYRSSVSNESLNALIRDIAGLASGGSGYAGGVLQANEYSGETLTGDARLLTTVEWDRLAGTCEAFTNGVSDGASEHLGDPGAAAAFLTSILWNLSATDDATVSYCLWVAGPRDPAVEAELLERFPAGEDMS